MNATAVFHKNSPYNQLKIEGTVEMHQCCFKSPTTRIRFNFTNMPPNSVHAIHIHEFSDFSQGCKSAGPHYNPLNKNHGSIFVPEKERHVGDLINNIISDSQGNFSFEYDDDLVRLMGPYSVINRSIIIHKKSDDYGLGGNPESLKTGNAGDRMACSKIHISDNFHF